MIRIYDLRTEYRKGPVVLDCSNPRFSWKLESDKQGVIRRNTVSGFGTGRKSFGTAAEWRVLRASEFFMKAVLFLAEWSCSGR